MDIWNNICGLVKFFSHYSVQWKDRYSDDMKIPCKVHVTENKYWNISTGKWFQNACNIYLVENPFFSWLGLINLDLNNFDLHSMILVFVYLFLWGSGLEYVPRNQCLLSKEVTKRDVPSDEIVFTEIPCHCGHGTMGITSCTKAISA